MRKIIYFLIVCCMPILALANNQHVCKPPINKQTLTYQKSTNTPVFFAGFIIELPPPKDIGYFNDNLIFKYEQDKTIYLTFSTNMLIDGREADYDPVVVFKEAFGILPKQAKNNSEINAIIRLQRLCENELISYQINNIDYDVIRTKYHNSFSDKSTIDTFILGEPKEVYMIGFKGFTNKEIDQLLSTIHKKNKK
ncbi:hypothetical protein [Entomomonas asaccharolytica]|uniref:Uncharacterized protein n=1 Tax=Entomomonas asaccharolytica TaxID=2785331 RepID=A0A974RYT8_9GAMM|nr:hypothetical protein [Entomomonas asaccharolytica]QQP86269.1 hypothetical protein JHT90_03230 [Entomomonas asaccharolytica]